MGTSREEKKCGQCQSASGGFDGVLLHTHRDPRAVRTSEVDALSSLHEIRRERLRYIHELLRIAVGQREPATLNLHHDAMALPEGVRDVGEVERYALGLTWHEWHGLLEALAKLAAERLAADQLLVAADRNCDGSARRI